MTRHSPRVFVVVDPVQDYEESLAILGVHGSLAAAKLATRRYRHQVGSDDAERDTEVQLWQGDQVLDTWLYAARTGRWTHHQQPARLAP